MGLFTDKRIKARCAAAVCAGMMLFGVSACGASSDAGSNVDLQTQESRVYIGGAEEILLMNIILPGQVQLMCFGKLRYRNLWRRRLRIRQSPL